MEKFQAVTFDKIGITGGFWKQKQDLVRDVSVKNVYKRFKETGRFDAFKFDWKEGDPNKPHIFWDSDIAKWIESVAFLSQKKREPELEKIVDEVVDLIEKNQDENGYFNIYFTVCEPDARFTRRTDHELYDAGHLIEAAVAYYYATGKDKFMRLMCKYADLIEKVFKIERSAKFVTPGHEEIELALVKLYHATGEKRYLDLSKFFIDERGKKQEESYDWAKDFYNQSHAECRKQTTAEGHSVRAVYLYSGMCDIAREYDDESLKTACETIFDNIAEKRMYITGGIGSSANGEMFTVDYDLPNKAAYSESCAALGLALFARRMLTISADSKYAEVIERVIYNGFLSSISLDGKSFFYENPLEVDLYLHEKNNKLGFGHYPPPHRFEVFGCSCCPPNITRFIASIADMLYTYNDDTVFVHQYMQSETEFDSIKLVQTTNYPYDGKVSIDYTGDKNTLAVRIPSWSEGTKISVNGKDISYETKLGYAYISVNSGDKIEIDIPMEAYLVEANPSVQNDANRVAVMRGPVLFCAEGKDNGKNLHDIKLSSDTEFTYGIDDELDVMTLTATAYRTDTSDFTGLYRKKSNKFVPAEIKLIPYYAFANRGDTDMLVWLGCL